MEITSRDRFWMRCRPYQFWRFMALNLKILKHSRPQRANVAPQGQDAHLPGLKRGAELQPPRAGEEQGARANQRIPTP